MTLKKLCNQDGLHCFCIFLTNHHLQYKSYLSCSMLTLHIIIHHNIMKRSLDNQSDVMSFDMQNIKNVVNDNN